MNGILGAIRTNQRDVETQFMRRFIFKQIMSDWKNLFIPNFLLNDGTDISLSRLFDGVISEKSLKLINFIFSIQDSNLIGSLAARNEETSKLVALAEAAHLNALRPDVVSEHPVNTNAQISQISRSSGVLLPSSSTSAISASSIASQCLSLPPSVTFPQCDTCGNHLLNQFSPHNCQTSAIRFFNDYFSI